MCLGHTDSDQVIQTQTMMITDRALGLEEIKFALDNLAGFGRKTRWMIGVIC